MRSERICNNPAPSNGGHTCKGLSYKQVLFVTKRDFNTFSTNEGIHFHVAGINPATLTIAPYSSRALSSRAPWDCGRTGVTAPSPATLELKPGPGMCQPKLDSLKIYFVPCSQSLCTCGK